MGIGFGECVRHIRLLRHTATGDAVSVGQLHEIGAEHGRAGVAFLVEKLLPLAHHAQESRC